MKKGGFRNSFIVPVCVFLLAGHFQVPSAFAKETYPSRKITWIVGAEPGGGADIMARGLIPYMEKYLRENAENPEKVGIVVRNVPGSSDLRAMSQLFHAKADGYTIACGTENLHTNSIMGTMEFNLLEVTYLSRLASSHKVLVTNKQSNLLTWNDVLDASRKAPLKIAITGFGGSNHIASIFFIDALGLPAKTIMFSGTAGASSALIRGDVAIGLNSLDSLKNLIDIGEVRPVLTFTEKPVFQGVPTIKDIGHPELIEIVKSQRYVIAPPGFPAKIENILENAMRKSLADKEFIAWKEKTGISYDPVIGPEAHTLVRSIHAQYMKREKLLKTNLVK